ncbi:MAG: 3-keto-disaccharide hydrolase [Thermoguttaceae bacterium]
MKNCSKNVVLTLLVLFSLLTLQNSFLWSDQLSEQEQKEGFVSLFNGKNLDNWEGNEAIWSVEDGVIVGQTSADGPAKLTYNQFLTWNGNAGDFVLRFDMKCTKAGNTGMQYRSWKMGGDQPFRIAGYQADFDGAHTYTGILYGENFRGILCKRGEESVIQDDHKPKTMRSFATNDDLKKELKVEDWNEYEVIADGFTFTNKINGHLMSICTDEDKESRRKDGLIAIQAHVGPPMKVEVKNIRLLKK